MTQPSWAGVVTAFSSVLTAIALVITAFAGYVKAKQLGGKVDSVHKIVNQQHTDLLRYQKALVKALNVAGVEVPDDQSEED